MKILVDKREYDHLKESAARNSEAASRNFQRMWSAKRDLAEGLDRLALDMIEVLGLTARYTQNDEGMTIDAEAFRADLAAAAEHLAETNKQSRGSELLSMFRAARAEDK